MDPPILAKPGYPFFVCGSVGSTILPEEDNSACLVLFSYFYILLGLDLIIFAASHVGSQLTSHVLLSVRPSFLMLHREVSCQAGQCHSSDWFALKRAPWL